MRKAMLVLLIGVGIASCLGSCRAGWIAFESTLDRQASALSWMHDKGYLVPPPPGTDSAFDMIPDWEAVVVELHETDLTTAFSSLGSWGLTLVSLACILLLGHQAWPRKHPASTVSEDLD